LTAGFSPPGVYSLYIHVPFCRSLCDYCDFYSVPLGSGPEARALVDRYIAVLAADARRLFEEYPPRAIPTIYIGGGTPSALGAEALGRLIGALGELPGHEGREWTVEANPESLDRDFLRVCREAGVTRLSLGIQSFSPRPRSLVHRAGGPGALGRGLELAAEFFPQDFSADLLSGLPGQGRRGLLGGIARLLSRRPAHVSLYDLSLEEGSPLWERAAELPPREEADRLWISGRDALEASGYEQYEVSNFCLPGKECRHNLRYWDMESWLALGPSGVGVLIDEEGGTGLRLSWPGDLAAWLDGAPDWRDRPAPGHPAQGRLARERLVRERLTRERLDPPTLLKESLLMGFRLRRGPRSALFQRRFGLSPEEAVPRTLARWRARGLIAPGPALNREGLLFLNAFLVEAFAELDSRASAPPGAPSSGS
jgi:oxygen-independent coproporphyrinogen-3 oxidase